MYKPFPPLPGLVSPNDIRKYSKQENKRKVKICKDKMSRILQYFQEKEEGQ